MKRVFFAATMALMACGPAMPGDELRGAWRVDILATLPASARQNVVSFLATVRFDANYTYVMTAQATSTTTAPQTPGCLTELESSGGTWSASTLNNVNTLVTAGTVMGTIQRTGCRNATDNFARRPAAAGEILGLEGGNYTVMGSTLILTSGSNTVTFMR
ncbi:MAG: hypothetical protein Q8Q09_06415 [Deltaproteobacteria bacterium]|nr:hypothetical protein [Deltaproteobacteria bacterium]